VRGDDKVEAGLEVRLRRGDGMDVVGDGNDGLAMKRVCVCVGAIDCVSMGDDRKRQQQ
jgi:hypothetical protein